jgi:hypothetical protein
VWRRTSDQYIYIYYTPTTPNLHRVSRFTANDDVAVPGSEVVIFTIPDQSSASNHNGGALRFAADGKLRGGVWQASYATYSTGAATPTPTPAPSDIAQITSPAPGSRLAASTVTFTWSAGTGVSEYWLSVGNTQDGSQLWGGSTGMARSMTVSNLPTDGRTVYVRVQSRKNGVWPASYATYTTGP